MLASVLLIADTCTEKYFFYFLYVGGNGGSDEISLRFFFKVFLGADPRKRSSYPSKFFFVHAGNSGVAR